MMQVRSVPLSILKEYENNAKVHDEANIDAIKASIERFGNCDPIGVWTNAQGELVIVEGHGRKMALEALGYDTAEVIMLDHLTDEERRAYTLAHNQTTLMTDFDLDALEIELEALADFGMEDFGFDADDEEGGGLRGSRGRGAGDGPAPLQGGRRVAARKAQADVWLVCERV